MPEDDSLPFLFIFSATFHRWRGCAPPGLHFPLHQPELRHWLLVCHGRLYPHEWLPLVHSRFSQGYDSISHRPSRRCCFSHTLFSEGIHNNRRFIRAKSGQGVEFTASRPDYPEADFICGECKAGTLVLIHGAVVHKSEENQSPKSRLAYTFHLIEDPRGGKTEYPADNWLVFFSSFSLPLRNQFLTPPFLPLFPTGSSPPQRCPFLSCSPLRRRKRRRRSKLKPFLFYPFGWLTSKILLPDTMDVIPSEILIEEIFSRLSPPDLSRHDPCSWKEPGNVKGGFADFWLPFSQVLAGVQSVERPLQNRVPVEALVS